MKDQDKMNTIKTILLAGSLCLLTTALVAGTPDPWPAHATTGIGTTTLSYGVISAHSANAGAPVVTYINATSDKAASVVQFYTCGSPAIVTGANTTVTIPCKTNSVSGFVANAIIVIQHLATDTYERRVIASVTSSTVVTTVAPTVATAAGDRIWVATTSGSIPVGAATLSLAGDSWVGQAQKPLLVEIDGTSACHLGAVAAKYVK